MRKKNVEHEHEHELEKENTVSDERDPLNRIALTLSFDTALGSEKEILDAVFNNNPAVTIELNELSIRSKKLHEILNEDPELAKQFTADPPAVVAKLFPELELKPPIRKPVEAERFHVMLQPVVPAEGAFYALRRTLELALASPSNASDFEADPLGIFYKANAGQRAADVLAAAQALEQVLGIYHIRRLPIDAWEYAANKLFTAHVQN